MGCLRFGVPDELAQLIIDHFAPAIFVETGTYNGDTAKWAARLFARVVTIEGSPSFYQRTRLVLSSFDNVDFILADSKEALPELLSTLKGSAMFWLDSHWMGGDSFGPGAECPLIAELEAISRFPYEQFILIDDAHLFLAPPDVSYTLEHWPTIDLVIEKLKCADPKRYIVVWDDVIVAVPDQARNLVSSFCQRRAPAYFKSFHPDTASVRLGMQLAQDGVKIAMRGLAQRLAGKN